VTTYPDIEKALYSKLTGTGAITALVSTRIYNLVAPLGTTRPYIVFYPASERSEKTTPVFGLNTVYRIEAAADNRSGAFTVQAAVLTALEAAQLSVTGYLNFWTANEGFVSIVENLDGRQFWRRIGDYRIRVSEV
jgi:hypothetical protein